MSRIPLDIGTIHFVGIGGIGMSGIAEILHNLGYKVQGSDLMANANVKRLREKGIEIHKGHAAENIGDASVVVLSSAIKDDNSELVAAKENMLPIVQRAEMLAELMKLKSSVAVGGTHGKTTTTSMVAALFDAAGLDPTVVNGGIINSYGTNARLGKGDWLVAEADESDGSFIKLPATVAVVTNIDPEHMEYYGSFDALRQAFLTFIENIPFYGFACLCSDHPEVQALAAKVSNRKVLTYGFSTQADVKAVDVRSDKNGCYYDVVISPHASGMDEKITIKDFHLPVNGRHNVQNSLVPLAIGIKMGFSEEVLKKTISSFSGVKRRFTKTGEVCGITVIDDYAHHPVEIEAVLSTAREVADEKVIAVFQPHRYSRLEDLFEAFSTCFNEADVVIVADVYAANEKPREGASKEALVESLRSHGHRHVVELSSPDQLAGVVSEIANENDIVVCMGAGNITAWAYALPDELRSLMP
ncbi:MAG: UDP-N-acetylmuramate--L-alanine ligase [Alphaproteobacteria bacterium]|nr:UDP-N-acetylmuramate--L-alanine ligase [Alphaproteobacteria bacterium]